MCGHKLTYIIRGAIYEVHKMLGCGLLKVPVVYKGMEIKNAYVLDILVEDKVIIELKSVEELTNLHYKQLINYLHLKNLYIGYIVNFNSIYLIENKDLKRIFNNEATDKSDL